jgi:hypothetical protein
MSYFKGGRVVSFAKRILRQELRSGKMCFASWHDFTEEFTATFCPENEATTALMRLESDWYFQAKQNVEAYIDGFKDLIDLSGYTDPITIVQCTPLRAVMFHKCLTPKSVTIRSYKQQK